MGSVGNEDIQNRFGYHPATDVTAPKHEQVREAFVMFAKFLDEILPHGRGKSMAFTKLQETSMWSNFAVAELAPVVLPVPTTPVEPKLF